MKSLAALACVAALPAAAAEGVQQFEPIEVEGHYVNGLGSSDAASAGTITRRLIEDRPISRPGEVLELVPGLVMTQHSGAGKANQYYLRGFNLDHGTDFLTTVAGMPVNMPSHAHGQGYTDLNFLIPELVSRIDYIKGPYSASKGDFASAGAADIHYADALAAPAAELTVGGFGYRRALLTGSPTVGRGRIVYGLELFHHDGPWERSDDFRKVNGVLRYVRADGDARWSVTAMGYGGRWNATDQLPRRAIEDGRVGEFGTLDATDGGRSHRYSVSADWAAPLAGGRARANAYAVRSDLRLFSNFTYFLDEPGRGDQFEQSEARRVYGAGGRWERDGALGSFAARVAAGFEVRHDRLQPVGLYRTVARERFATTREDRVRQSSGALYGEGEVTWHPAFRTVAGLRLDGGHFEVDSDNAVNSGTATGHRFSPKLSVIGGPWAKTELFANYGTGFHSNDARGATTRVDPRGGDAVMPVTPLAATRGYELGVRSEWLPGVQSSLALWRLELDSELVFVGDAGTTDASRASRRSGLEWSTRWRPRAGVLVDLDAAWSRARFRDADPAGAHVPGAIETAVSAGLTVGEAGPWSGSVFLRYFGPRALVEDNSVRSPASTLVNGRVAWRLGPGVRLALEVFNLFDRRADDVAYYYASRLPGEPPAGFENLHVHPAEKRSARLTVSLSY